MAPRPPAPVLETPVQLRCNRTDIRTTCWDSGPDMPLSHKGRSHTRTGLRDGLVEVPAAPDHHERGQAPRADGRRGRARDRVRARLVHASSLTPRGARLVGAGSRSRGSGAGRVAALGLANGGLAWSLGVLPCGLGLLCRAPGPCLACGAAREPSAVPYLVGGHIGHTCDRSRCRAGSAASLPVLDCRESLEPARSLTSR